MTGVGVGVPGDAPGPGSTAPGSASTAGSPRLGHVQALRAVAVLGVVAFHFWARLLPGGFIGVDVFFVISGFLITGHLVRAVETGRFSFGSFYLRRARRLLPAAGLVACVTIVVAWAVLPINHWYATFTELAGAMLYVENWALVLGGSDYFGTEVTAAQHYWSLSVEEQFYLVWPLLIVLLFALGRLSGSPDGRRRVVATGLALVGLASLTASVLTTWSQPQLAYFATHTRAWEFATGALLALAPTAPLLKWRVPLGWLALAVVGGSMITFRESWAFPGWIAAIPVAATAVCLWTGLGERNPLARVALSRPVQHLGDISYSLYLWHWPIVVLAPLVHSVFGERFQHLGGLALALVLAHLTHRWVENRFRVGGVSRVGASPSAVRPGTPTNGSPRRRQGERLAAVLIFGLVPVLVVGGAVVGRQYLDQRQVAAALLEERARTEGLACFGAAAVLDPGCTPPFGEALVPDLGTALREFRQAPTHDCLQDVLAEGIIRCERGDVEGDVHIALIGDSHALSWFPAVEQAALRHGWRVTTLLRGSCPVSAAQVVRGNALEEARCRAWAAEVLSQVATEESVDVVITSALNNKEWENGSSDGLENAVHGYEQAWRTLAASGKQVVALGSTPLPRADVVDCLAEYPAERCARSVLSSRQPGVDAAPMVDPMRDAVRRLDDPDVVFVDPLDHFCVDGRCPAVAGNVVVYVDESHVSLPYARSLAPLIERSVTGLGPR